jgi:myo-inositol-1(or 4)-monophosphatase
MDLPLKEICEQACSAVVHTGRFIRQEMGKVADRQIEEKDLNSLVSYVDKEAEKQLVAALQELLPGSVFLTEEETVQQQDGRLRWIIDPLDGTTNFLYQLPVFSISVALQLAGTTVLGIVYELNRQECFYAWKEGGAYLNGQAISVSTRPRLEQSLLATGFPYYDYQRLPRYFKALDYFMQHSRGIRRLGSAAVDLAYVACGRFDGFFEYSLQAWDVAGGAFIVQEAGGLLCDFSGGDNFLFGQEMIAANPLIMPAFLEVIKRSFHS